MGKENSLILFWRTITESLLSSNGGFYTFAKLVLFRLLVLVVRDSVITLSEIAYNVNNNQDKVLLPIVCIVYFGNIITRSYLVVKVAFVALYSSVLVQRKAGSHAEGIS